MKPIKNLPSPYRLVSNDYSAPGGPPRLREANVRHLLGLLHRHTPCSRADLVRLSGLTAPTVSAAIGSLQRRDLVTAIGNGSSSGGRPPGLLEFNARHGYVVGADIGGSNVRLALADLNGAVIGRWNAPLRAERSPKAVIEKVWAGISYLRQQYKVPLRKILQLAAGAPGITDVTAGRVLSAPNLIGWNDVPLRDLLQDKTHIATTVENDVNLGALGESWCGAAQNVTNFVFLSIGTGAGAGIVLNGRLHHGATWSAGEVGYLLIPGLPDDPPSTDRPGALESAIGGHGIEQAWIEDAAATRPAAALRATDIFDLALAGDRKAREFLNRAAAHLAMAVTNLTLVLDLSLVVLSGGTGGHPGLLQAVQRRLERNQFARPTLVLSDLNGEAQLYGAIYLALQTAETHGFRHRPARIGNKRQRALAGIY
jgi:predicted NBD/HSP70 family sugar kinase